MRTRILVGSALLAAAGAAPDAVSQGLACVPKASPVVVQIDGPEVLRARLLATNLGTLLAAKDADDVRGLFGKAMRAGLADWLGVRAAPFADELVDRLAGYGGRVTIALQPGAGGVRGVVHWAADGETDLVALGASLGSALAEGGRAPRLIRVEGAGFTVVPIGMRGGFTLPVTRDGAFVVFFGDDVRAAIAAAWDTPSDDQLVPDAAIARAPIGVRSDLATLLADAEVSSWWWGVARDHQAELRAALGFSALRDLTLTVGARGPQVQIEASLGFAPGVPRGLVDGFLPETREPPQLARLVPDGTQYWQSAKLRVDQMLTSLIDVVVIEQTRDDEDRDEERKEIEDQVRQFFGCDPIEDVLVHLDDDVLILGSLFADVPEPQDDDPDAGARVGDASGTVVFAWQLADVEAFDRGWASFVGSPIRAFLPPTEVRVHGDVDLHVVTWSDRDSVAWALLDDLFVIGFGEKCADWTAAVLDRGLELERTGGERSTLPPALQRLRRAAPDGLSGCAGFDVDGLLALPIRDLLDLDEYVPSRLAREFRAAVDRMRPLLEQYGLRSAVAFSGWSENRWTYRALW